MTADENVEETVMLTRRDRRRAVARGASDSDAVPGEGAVEGASVDPAAVDEATVVVDRSPDGASEPADEATVVVDRSVRRSRRDADTDTETDTGTAADAEVEAFAAPAEPAPAIYKPRPAPREPSAPPVVVGGEAPTRIDDPERPSVAKQARRWGVLTLAAFVVACVASVAGLIGVGFLAFS